MNNVFLCRWWVRREGEREEAKDQKEPRQLWRTKLGAYPTKYKTNKEIAFNTMWYRQNIKPYANENEKKPQE